MHTNLTQEQLKQALHYDPETGVFVWLRKPCKNREPGDIAGGTEGMGYRVIRINGTLYKAHRLAWLYVHGGWPAGCIDHINGLTGDNRIANLRCVTHGENMQNRRRAHSNSRTGALGVTATGGKFVARIRVGGRLKSLGRFLTLEEASAAYLAAKRQLHVGCTL